MTFKIGAQGSAFSGFSPSWISPAFSVAHEFDRQAQQLDNTVVAAETRNEACNLEILFLKQIGTFLNSYRRL